MDTNETERLRILKQQGLIYLACAECGFEVSDHRTCRCGSKRVHIAYRDKRQPFAVDNRRVQPQ
jgi:hypothetical protein